jgi:hypothetical protein
MSREASMPMFWRALGCTAVLALLAGRGQRPDPTGGHRLIDVVGSN